MPRQFGLEYRLALNEAAAPASPRMAYLRATIWYGAVRIGLSLPWDSPEKSWYRRVPP